MDDGLEQLNNPQATAEAQPVMGLEQTPMPVYEELTDEEREYKDGMKAKIRSYVLVFPERCQHLVDMNRLESDGFTFEEVEKLLERVKFTVNIYDGFGSLNLYTNGINLGIKGMEAVGTKMGMKVDGLTRVAMTNKQIQDQVKECALQFANVSYVDPTVKLVGSLVTAMVQMDAIRRVQEQTENKTVKVETQEKFNDL